MLKNFNLLISTYRGREEDCITEIWYFLKEIGSKKIETSKTGFPGLIVVNTDINSLDFIKYLKKLIEEKPWEIKYILKIVPINKVVESNIKDIKEAVFSLVQMIPKDDTYKIELRRRGFNVEREEIIKEVASSISNKVDLNNPDKIVRIEIIGKYTGIGVIKKEDIFSAIKERRKSKNLIH